MGHDHNFIKSMDKKSSDLKFVMPKTPQVILPSRVTSDINAHCNHLDNYISQKTRLCVVDLEGEFQTSLEAKLINFLI